MEDHIKKTARASCLSSPDFWASELEIINPSWTSNLMNPHEWAQVRQAEEDEKYFMAMEFRGVLSITKAKFNITQTILHSLHTQYN